METIYRLAEEEDYPKLIDKYDAEYRFGWPTVVAVRGDEYRGMLGTIEDDDFVVAGPFYADTPMVMIRVATAYENIMKMLNVHKYYFFILKENEHWLKQMRKFPAMVERLDMDTEDRVWFEHEIQYPEGVRYQYSMEMH